MAKYKKPGTRSNWIRMYLNITVDVPCVYRRSDPYCSTRFYETHILRRHPVMIPRGNILKYCFEDTIPIYDMTRKECAYFNTLITQFNMAKFTTKDKLFLMSDVVALWKFLTISATCSNGVNALTNIGGFVRMSDSIILPYVMSTKDGAKYVPTFFFEDGNEAMQQGTVQGSLLPYLKLCCYILGISKDLVKGKVCKVVSLDQVKMLSPPHVDFEDVWPMARVMEKVEVVDENSASLNWLLNNENQETKT